MCRGYCTCESPSVRLLLGESENPGARVWAGMCPCCMPSLAASGGIKGCSGLPHPQQDGQGLQPVSLPHPVPVPA